MSTAARPKQVLPLLHGTSLLDLAVDRARQVVDADNVWLGVGPAVAASLASAVPQERRIVEPSGRDTMPAIGLAMAAMAAADPDAVVAVLTADHVIEPVSDLADALHTGFELAEARDDALVTFGVRPDYAATGFGYLELAEPIDGTGAWKLSRFREKPDLDTAQEFLAAGPERYLWNSGMFVWRAETFLRALDAFCPDDAPVLRKLGAAVGTSRFDTMASAQWPTMRKVSVDYAVLELASVSTTFDVAAVPLSARWLDVGSWSAVGDALGRDEQGNAVSAHATLLDSADNVVVADDGRRIALLGCSGLVVVSTPNAVLVMPVEHAQRVKDLHALVAADDPDLA
jgi:mannose-1-phosphate guanylyltransferase